MKKKAKILLMVLILCAVFGGCANMGKEEKQLLIKRTSYNENDEMTGWTEYEYDEEGNVIRENYYTENSELGGWAEYKYDKEGNRIERKYYDENGEIFFEVEGDYEGNVLRSVSYSGTDMYEVVRLYDEQGRVKTEQHFSNGEKSSRNEYIYDNRNEETRKNFFYDENGEEETWRWEYERLYSDDGKVLSEYAYLVEDTSKSLSYWREYIYNTQGDCVEIKEYNDEGSAARVQRSEYLYDDQGNTICFREFYDDFAGDVSTWYKKSYDEWKNEIEHITYHDDRSADYVRYVNEYKTITVDKERLPVEEEKSAKISDEGKLEFMKKLKDCMENKNYEAISELLETRDTMWNTIYFQNNQLVDELSDGEALIYSYGSGVYYGQVVNGKRQGQGVQWKDDTRWAKEYGNQYYYIDGEWRDNKGNGYCKIFYSLRGITKDKKPLYAYIEGNYTDSMEDGEMSVTWLGVDQSVCTDTYQACNGEIQGEFEKNDSGRYKICEDEGGSGNVLWDASTTEKGFPRKIYDQID